MVFGYLEVFPFAGARVVRFSDWFLFLVSYFGRLHAL